MYDNVNEFIFENRGNYNYTKDNDMQIFFKQIEEL